MPHFTTHTSQNHYKFLAYSLRTICLVWANQITPKGRSLVMWCGPSLPPHFNKPLRLDSKVWFTLPNGRTEKNLEIFSQYWVSHLQSTFLCRGKFLASYLCIFQPVVAIYFTFFSPIFSTNCAAICRLRDFCIPKLLSLDTSDITTAAGIL
jgi:hypothetical protein